MSKRYLILLAIVCVLLPGCLQDTHVAEQQKWVRTMEHADKKPYGTYLAYESLKDFFPGARIEALPRGFRFTSMDNDMRYGGTGKSVIILEGLYFYLSEQEWYDLKRFIRNGNEVVIFTSWLDEKIEKELNCYKHGGGEENNYYNAAKESFDNRDLLTLSTDRNKKYGYQGRSLRGYFSFEGAPAVADTASTKDTTSTKDSPGPHTDSAVMSATPAADSTSDTAVSADAASSETSSEQVFAADTLGYTAATPDMMRYAIGEGHITLNAAPLALSNYFLLQSDNINYLTGIWQTLPTDVDRIYWLDFYMRQSESSSWDILWRNLATRLALILGLIILGIYILFEAKRKQRIIPVIPPLKNDSVSFVETVGRLYYNKGNHANLADKMVQQFLEWVRSHYFLNTNQINDAFIAQLVIKSGQPEAAVRSLADMIHELRLGGRTIDEAYLYQLYNTIQQFYKNNRK